MEAKAGGYLNLFDMLNSVLAEAHILSAPCSLEGAVSNTTTVSLGSSASGGRLMV